MGNEHGYPLVLCGGGGGDSLFIMYYQLGQNLNVFCKIIIIH